jgi:peptidoglycan/LPS O-acetylase OafA/YrhL
MQCQYVLFENVPPYLSLANSMDPVSPLPAIAASLVAIVTAILIKQKFGVPPEQGRFSSIDGLRGHLAFFVFLHHSCIWYFYLRSGQWQVPPSNLYTHFGQSGIALFFMITAFLFFSKLMDGRTRSIDWGKLFISRCLRLVPLYVFVMLLLFLVVAYLSNGILKEPIPKLMDEIARWLGFTILGGGDINGIEHTSIIVAGAMWSLPYEWLFYLSLPLLALTVRVIPPTPYIAFAIASVVGLLAVWHPKGYPLLSFLGGIVAANLVRSDSFRSFAVTRVSSFIVLGCVGIAVAVFPSATKFLPIVFLSVAFALIASGNSLFGLLVCSASRTLGAMAYSIYLLHGIALFVTFTFVLGVPESRALSPMAHWFVVIGITPILILISSATFRFIEHPAMQKSAIITAWLRSRLTPRPKGHSTAPLS